MAVVFDEAVTLAPYFLLKDAAKFKDIWRADYAAFKHKEDCVHYAFGFEGEVRAHCREAYTNADAVLQHMADIRAPLKAALVPSIAELQKLEVHCPESELNTLRGELQGATFFVTEWSFRSAKPAMEKDTMVHHYTYYAMKDEEEFKKFWQEQYPRTIAASGVEQLHQYAFSFDDKGMASCRETYADAAGLLLRLKREDRLGGAIAAVAEIDRYEVHGPAAELEKLKPMLGPMGAQFFAVEWGFRNAVGRGSA